MLPRGGAGHCGADHCGPGLRLCGPDLTKEEAGTDVHQVLTLSTPLSLSLLFTAFLPSSFFFSRVPLILSPPTGIFLSPSCLFSLYSRSLLLATPAANYQG